MAAPRTTTEEACRQSRKCSKVAGHKGRCNSEKPVNSFWESSSVFKLNTRKRKLFEEEKQSDEKRLLLNDQEEALEKTERLIHTELNKKEKELCDLLNGFQEMKTLAESTKKELSVVTQQNEHLKSMISSLGLDCKQFSKSKREQNSTSADTKSTTRHRRRKETEKALTFIHGGTPGSYHGAWDYIVANGPKELVGEFITGYKRGKYLQEVFEKAMKEHQASPEALKQAIATKYQNFLSRRKFNLVCKTQTSYFNAESEVWVPRNVKCVGLDLRVPRPASNAAVDKFVKELNIGTVNQIPNAPGVSRTMTGLLFMIIDLHLRVPHLAKKLVWFNDLENHFIFQFSDDGAPETSQMTMSIGSLTMWNLGDRVRSSDFQYLLHCVSLGEKHEVLENLWKQHTDEMALLEGNIITVCGKKCTVEFQPSTDMCWQSWANNELNQAATYPSPYANIHKGSFCTMGGSIGCSPTDTWKPYSNADRSEDAKKVAKFMSTVKSTLTEKSKHDKKLAYMAENGIRQLGPPRIGQFADRQRPEPLHCEINAWQQILSIIYLEFVKRDMFDVFVKVLGRSQFYLPFYTLYQIL
ncbi:hypothetical protein OS493_007866 [Desmophyllum pertusum]|uniref:Uncharacterized protein n=1 Tax=Desmophyllum pertusum TaxID=174260 RepID=A0A9W9YV11_9CNID|nr:hypothetical protein OS493_007866 [Desmophyllum pertusum]